METEDILNRIATLIGTEPTPDTRHAACAIIDSASESARAVLVAALDASPLGVGIPPSTVPPGDALVARRLAHNVAAALWDARGVGVFRDFSQALTGWSPLTFAASRQILARASIAPEGAKGKANALCTAWVDAGSPRTGPLLEALLSAPERAALAKQLLFAWYTASWRLATEGDPSIDIGPLDPIVNVATSMQALLWPTIGAHAPMLPGGYFGHWRYPPEA